MRGEESLHLGGQGDLIPRGNTVRGPPMAAGQPCRAAQAGCVRRAATCPSPRSIDPEVTSQLLMNDQRLSPDDDALRDSSPVLVAGRAGWGAGTTGGGADV